MNKSTEASASKNGTMNSKIIALVGSNVACACGHKLAPHPSARHKLPFNTLIKACKTCGVDIMPFGAPEAVGEGLCACCMSKPSTVRVEVGKGLYEPWCGDCLDAADAHMATMGLKP
jgi:hypothetical protein